MKNRPNRRWSLRWGPYEGPKVRAYAF